MQFCAVLLSFKLFTLLLLSFLSISSFNIPNSFNFTTNFKEFLIFFRYNELGGDGGGQFKVECVMDFGVATGSGHTKVNFFAELLLYLCQFFRHGILTFFI